MASRHKRKERVLQLQSTLVIHDELKTPLPLQELSQFILPALVDLDSNVPFFYLGIRVL